MSIGTARAPVLCDTGFGYGYNRVLHYVLPLENNRKKYDTQKTPYAKYTCWMLDDAKQLNATKLE